MGMSYRVAFDVTDPATGLQHPVILSGGLWHGDVLLYDFSLMHQGLAGRMEAIGAARVPPTSLRKAKSQPTNNVA